MKLSWVLFVASSLLGGCMPSRETRSAGQVGCSADEITISEGELHPGLLQSGESWVADCRGRTFICSQVNQVKDDRAALGSFAAQQVSCREEAESPQEERNRRARERAETTEAKVAPAPVGAAGFDLGLTLDQAQQRCESAGQRWETTSRTAAICSGSAIDVGIPVNLSFGFCEGRACSILVEHRPAGNWPASVVSLKAKLVAKYGEPAERDATIPKACRSDAQFEECLAREDLKLSYRWRWASGETVEMLVGKPAPEQPASIRLLYASRGIPANMSGL